MNIPRRLLITAASSLLYFGCNRPTSTPPTGFRLTLQDVATDTDARAALLTIRTTSEGAITVDENWATTP